MVKKVLKEENSRTELTLYPLAVKPRKAPQVLAAALATMGALAAGSFMSWTSAALPLLQAKGSLTDEEGSWVGAVLNVGAFLGALPAGALADRLGRQRTLLLLSLPLGAAWVLIAVANSLAMLLAGRILAGAAIGAVSVAAPMYVAELAEARVRGALGTLFQLQMTIGILFGYLVGLTEDYLLTSYISLVVPVFFLATFFWMPESPVFLLSQNKKEEAKKSLQWFRGAGYDVEDELTRMRDAQQQSEESQATCMDLVTTRSNVLALVAALGLMVFQQLSGINAVIFYSGQIFTTAGSSLSPATASVIVGVVQVAATYVSTLLVDRAGRRALLLISDSVMALCLGALGLYFYLQTAGNDVSSASWLPLAAVALFIVVFSLGFGPIPWIMVGELFPASVKGTAGALAAALSWILSFVVTKAFQNLLDSLGPGPTFWVFSSICALGTVFVATLVPETKGKSLEEIQAELSGRRRQTDADVMVRGTASMHLTFEPV